MTQSKRTDEQIMAAAPVRFTLADESFEARPLGFGEGSLWLDDALGLLVEICGEARQAAGLESEPVNSEGIEGAIDLVSLINKLDGSRGMLRVAPRALDLVCRFAHIEGARRENLDRSLGQNFMKSANDIMAAFMACLETANPTQGAASRTAVPANGKAESSAESPTFT